MDTKYNTQVSPTSHAVTLTVDCAIFGYADDALRVLLVRRAVEPFAGQWVLPGGAMQGDETLEETAVQLLRNLVNVENVPIRQVATYSDPDRHPVRRVVTTSYYALVSPKDHHPEARQYLAEVNWCRMDELPPLGFDHRRLLDDAYATLKDELSRQPLAFHLLPESFTLKEAQEVYEAILGEDLDRRNFRRKILAYDFLINTSRKKSGVKGGPDLYRIDDDKLVEHLQ